MEQDATKSVRELVEAIIADGKLERSELKRFDEVILADGQLNPEEQQWIAKLLDLIASGKLEVID